ncbi:hypothetical protein EZV62_007515 [Acer yangbiense]|uniref:Reverse transcriptase Ty1/copia-type domain-containing protein n=1 Tax=Acer yangbiense TaxID=1000413 RepID=A0A5C7IA92_9ROSI|nr:hypothetical protein EZV62_007515 [Acer yangbiense]
MITKPSYLNFNQFVLALQGHEQTMAAQRAEERVYIEHAQDETIEEAEVALILEICGRSNHPAINCWYWFDYSYQSEELPQALAAMALNENDLSFYVDVGATSHMFNDPGQDQALSKNNNVVIEDQSIKNNVENGAINLDNARNGATNQGFEEENSPLSPPNLLNRTQLLESTANATPMSLKEKALPSDHDPVDASSCRSIVGALQYITFTRPDIIHAINQICQHFNNSIMVHMKAVKRILRYLRGTQDFGVRFLSGGSLSLNGFCDADWAGCPTTRHSTSGFYIFLGANCISLSSKKQPTVSRSSSKAKYRFLASATAKLTWLTFLLLDSHHSIHRFLFTTSKYIYKTSP